MYDDICTNQVAFDSWIHSRILDSSFDCNTREHLIARCCSGDEGCLISSLHRAFLTSGAKRDGSPVKFGATHWEKPLNRSLYSSSSNPFVECASSSLFTPN